MAFWNAALEHYPLPCFPTNTPVIILMCSENVISEDTGETFPFLPLWLFKLQCQFSLTHRSDKKGRQFILLFVARVFFPSSLHLSPFHSVGLKMGHCQTSFPGLTHASFLMQRQKKWTGERGFLHGFSMS